MDTKINPFIRPCSYTYIWLIVLTLITWFVGINKLSGLHISLLVLGIALLKVQLIGDYFMGLKRVSSFWRWVISIWLLLVGTLISIAFNMAS